MQSTEHEPSKYNVFYVTSQADAKTHLAYYHLNQDPDTPMDDARRICDHEELTEVSEEHPDAWFFYGVGPIDPFDTTLERKVRANLCQTCEKAFNLLPWGE